MALITTTQLKRMTDTLGAIWRKTIESVGKEEDQTATTPGTIQDKISDILTMVVSDFDDLDLQTSFGVSANSALALANAEALMARRDFVWPLLNGLNTLCRSLGKTVSASIVDLESYLNYYNGGSGGAAYSCLVCPEFAEMWEAIMGEALPAASVMSRAIHPTFNADSSAEGMGSIAVGEDFVDGDAIDTSVSAPVFLLLEVVTTFVGGATNPSVVIQGLDENGVLATYDTIDLGASNPATGISTTITPNVVADEKQSVTLGSLTGIQIGSVLTVNSGLVDEEVIVVEDLPGSSKITAVFRKAHTAGAAITGKLTFVIDGVAYRISNILAMTLTVGDHSAGKVRVVGRQDRVAV